MKWIGLTGGIATGKSTVAKILRTLGYPVVDADELAKKAVLPGSSGLKSIGESFGTAVLNPDGSLNRKKLGEIVFQNESQRLLLESLIHPVVQKLNSEEKERLRKSGVETAFYDVPLLFEKNLQDQFDSTVIVYCPVQLQIERLMRRNQISKDEAVQRINSQMPIDDKKKLATFIIDNSGPMEDLPLKVEHFCKRLA